MFVHSHSLPATWTDPYSVTKCNLCKNHTASPRPNPIHHMEKNKWKAKGPEKPGRREGGGAGGPTPTSVLPTLALLEPRNRRVGPSCIPAFRCQSRAGGALCRGLHANQPWEGLTDGLKLGQFKCRERPNGTESLNGRGRWGGPPGLT